MNIVSILSLQAIAGVSPTQTLRSPLSSLSYRKSSRESNSMTPSSLTSRPLETRNCCCGIPNTRERLIL